MAKKVMSFSLDDDLCTEFEEFSERLNVNKSQALQMLLTATLRGQGAGELIKALAVGGSGSAAEKKRSVSDGSATQFLA